MQKKEMNKKVKKIEMKFNFSPKKIFLWLMIGLMFVPFLLSLIDPSSVLPSVTITQAIQDIRDGKVDKIELQGDEMMLSYFNEEVKVSRKEEGSSLIEILQREGIDDQRVQVEVASQAMGRAVSAILVNVLPIVGFGFILWWMTRSARGMQSSVFGFGKSKAKLFAKGKQDVSFADVAGVNEAKSELEEVVDFLKNPKKYKKLGARTPKGVLLVGPAGVGKTLLAKAVAGEAGVPFFSMAGSEFMEMLVGVGASRVRDLFLTAKKASPSIIFIDELDAIGRTRGVGTMGGHDEREQTLNQILVEMDGFTPNDNVIVISATNRPDVLDPALVRPGRFDRRVSLDLPDIQGRKEILSIHAKGKPFDKSVSWDLVSKRTVGYSGADLENMLNEAAILTARENRSKITSKDINEAALKVKLGPEKKRLQSELEREMTAFHEAGHAVVGHFLAGTDPVHRISIVSRLMSLGQTLALPDRDKYQQTKSELIDTMAMMMGGRAAEELFFGELTAGASSDIERATRVARKMVVDLGMSSLGPVALGPSWEMADWGKAYMEPSEVSESMKERIDHEVKRYTDEAYLLASRTLKKHASKVEKLVDRLLKNETVEADEFEKLMGRPKISERKIKRKKIV